MPEEHPVWTKNGWKVFLDNPPEVWGRIRYVESNPMKEGLARQEWPFVVPYDNWPFHKRAELNRKRMEALKGTADRLRFSFRRDPAPPSSWVFVERKRGPRRERLQPQFAVVDGVREADLPVLMRIVAAERDGRHERRQPVARLW